MILVEQSVNVALTVAETAYFMEKGEIRFHGPTSELLERPDVLRSVFLEGAASVELGVGAPAVVHVNGELPAAAPVVGPLSANGANGQGDLRVRVDGVSKHFGGIAALDDVSFDVRAGEVLGFLGPNGAGKTTLFDVLSGFQTPSQGDIELDGDVHRRARPGRCEPDSGSAARSRTGGCSPPSPWPRRSPSRSSAASTCATPWPPRSTCRRSSTRRPRWRPRVEELIELLGLGAFRDKFVRELSTGSRRVVDLACVLAHGPARAAARRAVLGDRAAGGRGARPAAPADPRA